MKTYRYLGYSISPYSKIGSPFKWEAYLDEMFVYADTLRGMKLLIRDHLEKSS